MFSPQAVSKFDKLAKLHVNNITIKSWDEVSKLRWFPALHDVRMVHWDLFGVSLNSQANVFRLQLPPRPIPPYSGCFAILEPIPLPHLLLINTTQDMNEEERRKMLGALLPNSPLINGAPIPDREAAERWYLRRCIKEGKTTATRYVLHCVIDRV